MCATDLLHWVTRSRAQVLVMLTDLHLNQIDVARHPSKKKFGMESKLHLREVEQRPCSHLSDHREALTPSRSSVVGAVPHGTHGGGCSPHHAHLSAKASHATLSSANSTHQPWTRSCARSTATPCSQGCVPLRHHVTAEVAFLKNT